MYNMYMISKIWGVAQTPCVIVNGAPVGTDPALPTTADLYPVAAGDNVIISVSTDPYTIPALYVSLETDGTTVKATLWTLDFMTFQYKPSAFAGAAVADANGNNLGTTDANGCITVSGVDVVTVAGSAAIPVNVPTNAGL